MGRPLNIWKRFATGLLALVYLFTTLGTVLSTHYCMGRAVSVQWAGFHASADPCGSNTHGCCHTDYKVLKLADVHEGASVHLHVLQLPALLPAPAAPAIAFFGTGREPRRSVAHAPPDAETPPLYIQHCTFRI